MPRALTPEEKKERNEERAIMAEVKVNDQNTRAITSQNKVEIEAIMELLLHHMDTARLEKEIAARNKEQYSFSNAADMSIQPQQ